MISTCAWVAISLNRNVLKLDSCKTDLCSQLKLPQIQKIMMEFEKQSEVMDMKEEMMNDAIDDAMGDEDDEEERYVDLIV